MTGSERSPRRGSAVDRGVLGNSSAPIPARTGAAIYAVRVSPALREACSVGSGEGWAHRAALPFRQASSLQGAPVRSERKGENVGTYEGGDQIDWAQQALQRHTVSSGDGLCVTCRVPGPCPYYEAATKVFYLSARLPRRLPGATRPALINARRVGRPGLLAGRVDVPPLQPARQADAMTAPTPRDGRAGLPGHATSLPHRRGGVNTQAEPITREHIRSAWRGLGLSLSARRRALEFIQAELAARVGYSRSAIAGAETGQGRAHRALWEACDRELMAGGELLAEFLRVDALVRALHAQTERERQKRRNERFQGLRHDIEQAHSAGLDDDTDDDVDDAEAAQAAAATGSRAPNDLLRAARLARRSPSGTGRVLSRREVAEAVSAWVWTNLGRRIDVDRAYIGKLERGEIRWPAKHVRAALRAVLGVATDAEIGLCVIYGASADEAHPLEPADTPESGGAAVHPPTLGRLGVGSSGSPTTLHITVSAGAEATILVGEHGSAVRVVVSAAAGAFNELDSADTEGARVYSMDARRRRR